jgi:hypothetical protein
MKCADYVTKKNCVINVNDKTLIKQLRWGEEIVAHKRIKGGDPKGYNDSSVEEYYEEESEDDDESYDTILYLKENEYTDTFANDFKDYEKDDVNIDVDNLKYAEEKNWCYGKIEKRKKWYPDNSDYYYLSNWQDMHEMELLNRIRKWWNNFDHEFVYKSRYECMLDVMYCYLEKVYFRKSGLVDSLAEWRKERKAAHQILKMIEEKIGKKPPICYRECESDPEIIPIPKEPQFEA